MNTATKVKTARRVSAPLIAITTPDPAATIAGILASYDKGAPPAIEWDCMRGMLRLTARQGSH